MTLRPSRSRSAAGALARGALVPIALVGVGCILACVTVSARATAGAAVGTGITMVAFGVPPLVMKITQTWSPPATMAAALAAYGGLVGLGGLAYRVLAPLPWLSAQAIGWTMLAGTAAATAGLMVAARRMRLPVFDPPGAGTEPRGTAR